MTLNDAMRLQRRQLPEDFDVKEASHVSQSITKKVPLVELVVFGDVETIAVASYMNER